MSFDEDTDDDAPSLFDDPEVVEVEVEAKTEDDQGRILVKLEDGREVWIPRSVIADSSEVSEPGDVGIIQIDRSWALEAGIS
jgi:hypothetical protein